MSERRPYRSELRARQADGTRRAVVEAATGLFVARGYAETTLDAVAAAAGVSRRTVVNAAGGKAALLGLARDFSLVGDDEPVPMADRPAVLAILRQLRSGAVVPAVGRDDRRRSRSARRRSAASSRQPRTSTRRRRRCARGATRSGSREHAPSPATSRRSTASGPA